MQTPETILAAQRIVTLADKPLFDSYIARYPCEVCELAFTNMFLWGECRQVRFCEYQEHLLFSFQKSGKPRKWYQPIGPDPARIIREALPPSVGFSWEDLHESTAKALLPSFDPVFQRDRCDYVYNRDDIADLPGERFAHKRNYIRRCETKFQPETVALSAEMHDEVLDVFGRWLAGKKQAQDAGIFAERQALALAMKHFRELQMTGIGVRIAGQMEAFAIAAPLTPSMVTEHFEKAMSGFTGLFQFVFREFAKSLPSSVTLINKEEDAGIAGLRTAKLDWNPTYLVNKYALGNAQA